MHRMKCSLKVFIRTGGNCHACHALRYSQVTTCELLSKHETVNCSYELCL